MQTHRYYFPVSGHVKGLPTFMASMLEDRLKDSPDCLGAYCMFPTDSATLDHVSFDTGLDGSMRGVELHTYTRLWEGREDDFMDCIQTNMDEIAPGAVSLSDKVRYYGTDDEDMLPQTYKYRFPAYGRLLNDDDLKRFTKVFEENLKDSPDCLEAYCCFPTDSDILDHVSFDTHEDVTESGRHLYTVIDGINLHTYTKLWEDSEYVLKECVRENLPMSIKECFGESAPWQMTIEGDVEKLGREGRVPMTLYHIAERKDLDAILEKGLIPGTGDNSYKNMEDYVYLTSEKDLAPWMAILKHLEDPVILEVDTIRQDISQGRMFRDRDFAPEGYSEYRTTKVIPPTAIKEAKVENGNQLGSKLRIDMTQQLERAQDAGEITETTVGLKRLEIMGVMDGERVDKLVESHLKKIQGQNMNKESGITDDMPWEDDFDRAAAEEFGNAVGLIPTSDSGQEL